MFFSSLILLFRLAFRNVWRNPKRSIITLFAVAVGVWSSTALSSLARGLSWGMAEDSIKLLTGHIQIHSPGYVDDPSIDYSMPPPTDALKKSLNAPEISHWAPRVRVPAVIMSERESYGVTLVGIDPIKEKNLSFVANAISQGNFLNSVEDNGLIVGEKLLSQLQTGMGKRLVLMSQGTDKHIAERGFKIKGTFKATLESTELNYIFVSLSVAQKMLRMSDTISEISLIATDKNSIDALGASLTAANPALDVSAWTKLQPLIVALLEVQGRFIALWFVIVFIAVSFGIVNTLLMAVFERSREIGLLQALGMKPPQIVAQVVLESFFLIALGALVGNASGLLTVWYFHNGLDISGFARGAAYVGAGRTIIPIIVLPDWIRVNVLVLIMGTLSSLYPAWRAARLTPIEAIRRT